MIYRWVGAHDSKEKTYKLPTHEWQLVKRAELAPSQNLPTPVPALHLGPGTSRGVSKLPVLQNLLGLNLLYWLLALPVTASSLLPCRKALW